MQNSAIHLKLNNIQNTKGNDKPQIDAAGGGDTGKGLQRSIWGVPTISVKVFVLFCF